MFYLVK